MRRVTVKEVRRWLKTLEENRYRRIVVADARRVAWFINNNLSEEDMPKSLVKRWEHAKYGKEKYLAKRYMEHLKQDETVIPFKKLMKL
tara:strand:- start:410 stop:673 length:264 start_codon:yes stop_codon:yes gene_type:complete